MSYDVDLECPCCGTCVTNNNFNYTYNMGYAIRHGGIEMHGRGEGADGRFTLDGAKAKDAAEPLAQCIEAIEAAAETLREREPDNGWGSVEGVVDRFLRPILGACRMYPDCIVRVS